MVNSALILLDSRIYELSAYPVRLLGQQNAAACLERRQSSGSPPCAGSNKAEAFAPAHLDKELYINGFSVGYSTPLGWL